MRGPRIPVRVRRYLVATIDGLVFTGYGLVVAVVGIGLIGLLTGGTGSPPYALTVGTLNERVSTPGLGFIELLTYVTSAIVVLGPVWHYSVGLPIGGTGRRAGEFEFAKNDSGATADGRLKAGLVSTTASETDNERRRPGWADELFDRATAAQTIPEGDFLRSAGSHPSNENEPTVSVTHVPTDERGESPAVDESLGGSDETTDDASTPMESNDSDPPNGDPVEIAESTEEIDTDGDFEPTSTAPDDREEGAANGSTDSDGSEGRPVVEGDSRNVELVVEDDPFERLAATIREARSNVERVGDRIEHVGAAPSVERSASILARDAERADRNVAQLSDALPNSNGSIADTVEAIRASGRRIEAALETFPRGG